MFARWCEREWRDRFERPYVHLVFGARQTGKSTLLNALVPAGALRVNLADPLERSRHLADPGEFARICSSLPPGKKPWFVFVDEAQSVPSVFDAVQFLYDQDRTRWRFVLCGSSARKLRRTGVNLLPGRSLIHRLFPLTLVEHPPLESVVAHAVSPLPFPWRGAAPSTRFPAWDLESRLAYGALPGVVDADPGDRQGLLQAYAHLHLEEEIRREALVKDWGAFVRFLQLAAAEAGQIVNYAHIAREAGLSEPTVKSHYQLLEDMFIGFRVPAFSRSPRKNLLSTPKFLFFDPGVRNAAAGLTPSPETVRANPGPLFEQWVGAELWKRLQYMNEGTLHHLRSKDGAEVDFIVERGGRATPIEAKWTRKPSLADARHLLAFLAETSDESAHGFVICRCPRPQRLHDRVTALPWFCL